MYLGGIVIKTALDLSQEAEEQCVIVYRAKNSKFNPSAPKTK